MIEIESTQEDTVAARLAELGLRIGSEGLEGAKVVIGGATLVMSDGQARVLDPNKEVDQDWIIGLPREPAPMRRPVEERIKSTGRDLNETETAIHEQKLVAKAARLAVIGAGRPKGGPLVDRMKVARQDLNALRRERTQILYNRGQYKSGKDRIEPGYRPPRPYRRLGRISVPPTLGGNPI